MLGTWFDESGAYKINIIKRTEKLQFMIGTAKYVGSTKNVGNLAVEVRLFLGEAVILPSILYNAEAFPSYTKEEIKDLERIQATILRQFLEVPKSTPYYGLLMETGWLTMEARLDYKKLMLFHNIMNSDEKRVLKKLLLVQKQENRKGTWYTNTCIIIQKYRIELDVTVVLKSEWKREVKTKLREYTEHSIRKECEKMTKTRTVRTDDYVMKDYLKELPVKLSRKILLNRLHMTKIPMNFKNNWSTWSCPLCHFPEASTEHYFVCQQTEHLRKAWEVSSSQETVPKKMLKNSLYMEDIQTLLEPKNLAQERRK